MTERERLIETICKGLAQNCGGNCTLPNKMYCQNCHILADYLLENGMIVPPCKVGDNVYRIVKMSTGVRTKIKAVSEKGGTTGIMTSCDPTIKRFIRCVTVTKNNIVNCCENYGKTVFLTKEEAEKALHKINHNSLCETETYIGG